MWASWDHALFLYRRGLGPRGLVFAAEQLAASGAGFNLYATVGYATTAATVTERGGMECLRRV